MDFNDTPEEAEYRAAARAWLDTNVPEHKAISHDDDLAAARAWQARKAAAGYAQITWPKEWGGGGGTPIQSVIFGQEEARHPVQYGYFTIGLGLCVPTVMAFADDATEQRFVDVISAHSYTQTAPVELQCFYAEGLRHVRDILGHSRRNLRFMQLMGEAHDITIPGQPGTFGEMMTPAGLREVASYADIIGPSTRSVIPLGPDQRLAAPTALVSDAHAAGLAVHVYTFRPENVFLAADFRNDSGPAARNPEGSIAEIRRYLATGIDGFFTDDPALGRAALA